MKEIKNSCDGCCAGMPIVNGIHINEKSKSLWSRNHMVCSEWRYVKGVNKTKPNIKFKLKVRIK